MLQSTDVSLPSSGRIECSRCFACDKVAFGETQRGDGDWRITNNPLAWGNPRAEIVVLGFSKGPTQLSGLRRMPHNEIAYKGSRHNVGRILEHVGALTLVKGETHKEAADRAISDTAGRFHFGSLIRCTVERHDNETGEWKGSGGGMLDRFVATEFGREITRNCVGRFLAPLPRQTRLVIMFGLGTQLGYVRSAFDLFQSSRRGAWVALNDVAYTDGVITVVHVEHFASQGALVPQWLSGDGHPRGRYGMLARSAVMAAIGR